jgi:hydrogenase maturation factor
MSSAPGGRDLPVIEASSYAAACSVVDGCLVCGDVAVPVTVVEAGDPDALCEDDHGSSGVVGVELVAPVAAGDRLLIHGGVAISRLEEMGEKTGVVGGSGRDEGL